MKNEWRAVVKYKPKDFEKIITLHDQSRYNYNIFLKICENIPNRFIFELKRRRSIKDDEQMIEHSSAIYRVSSSINQKN